MNNKDKKNSAKKLRILRFSGVLAFVGTFIFALIYTGNDQFLKRCVANGNSVKYCNDIYDDRNLAFKDKQLEKEEKRRQRELEKEEKRKQRIKKKLFLPTFSLGYAAERSNQSVPFTRNKVKIQRVSSLKHQYLQHYKIFDLRL